MWVILTLHFNTLPLFFNLRNIGYKIFASFYSTVLEGDRIYSISNIQAIIVYDCC